MAEQHFEPEDELRHVVVTVVDEYRAEADGTRFGFPD
jgi:hypothetical protein